MCQRAGRGPFVGPGLCPCQHSTHLAGQPIVGVRGHWAPRIPPPSRKTHSPKVAVRRVSLRPHPNLSNGKAGPGESWDRPRPDPPQGEPCLLPPTPAVSWDSKGESGLAWPCHTPPSKWPMSLELVVTAGVEQACWRASALVTDLGRCLPACPPPTDQDAGAHWDGAAVS